MLELRPLRRDQIAQAHEWELAVAKYALGEPPDLETYTADLTCGRGHSFAIYQNNQFCGALFLAEQGPEDCEIHVAYARRVLKFAAVRQCVIALGEAAFLSGFKRLHCWLNSSHRAAVRLAKSCLMEVTEVYETDQLQTPGDAVRYTLTAERWFTRSATGSVVEPSAHGGMSDAEVPGELVN